MNPFHEYRWQDHVVRSGWWKLDLMLAAVSICVISTTFDAEQGSDRALASSDRPRSAPCDAGEGMPRAEIADASKKDALLKSNCAQHGDAREKPSSDAKNAGRGGPST
jgi:hypothetical protein